MRWLVVVLAILLGGKALWSLRLALQRNRREHWLTALGSAWMAFALVSNAGSWVAAVGLGIMLVGRSLRAPAVTGDQPTRRDAPEPKVEVGVADSREETPGSAAPYVKRLRMPAPQRMINPFTKEEIVGEAFVPPDTTPSAEHGVRASAPTFRVSTSNGGHLVASTPTLELAIRVTHLPDVEVGMLLVSSSLSDDQGRIWATESAVSARGLCEPFAERKAHKSPALHFFDEADAAWQRAFEENVLARGVASLHDSRDWTTLRIGSSDHAVYFYYESPKLDVALLDPQTILVRVTELTETPDPDDRSETRPLRAFVYALPVERLFWFIDPEDHHARHEDGWVALREIPELAVRETDDRRAPSPNIHFVA